MKKKRSPKDPPPTEPEISVEEIGSGMTTGTRTTYSGEAAGRELRALLERPTRGPFGDIEDNCRAFLQEEGPPPPLRALAKEERASMRWYAAAVLKELERMESHLADAADAAGRLAKRSSRINKAITEGLRKKIRDASYNAALTAYRAGTMNREARGKSEDEGPWLMGRTASFTNRNKALIRGKQIAAEKKVTEEVRKALRARASKMKPDLSKRSKAELLKQYFPDLGVESIRKNI